MKRHQRLTLATSALFVTLGLSLGPALVNSVRVSLNGGVWCEFLQPGGALEIRYGAAACEIPAEVQAEVTATAK
jgi:hypothetical protein